MPLNKRVVYRIGILMYKYVNDLLPPALYYLYTSNSYVRNYTTIQKNHLHVNKSGINAYSDSFSITSTRIWNVLQCKIDVNTPLSKFKISLKLYSQEHSLQLKYRI